MGGGSPTCACCRRSSWTVSETVAARMRFETLSGLRLCSDSYEQLSDEGKDKERQGKASFF